MVVEMAVENQSPESKRFAEIYEVEGWTQAGLASDLGYKDSSIISLYLNGSRPISDQFLYRLENKKNVSAHYIRTGRGPQRIGDEHLKTQQGKQAYADLLEQLADEGIVATESSERYNGQFRGASGVANMWVVPPKAQAGFIAGFIGRVFSKEIKREPFPDIQGECFKFDIEGVSMIPEYMPGDKIVCTILNDITWLRRNKVYVFQTAEGLIIKYFDKIEENKILIRAANDKYNPTAPIPMDEIQVIYNIEYGIVKK